MQKLKYIARFNSSTTLTRCTRRPTRRSALMCNCPTGGVDTACDVRTEYQCRNGNCIPLSSFNNSVNDCVDNSDEGETDSFLIWIFHHNIIALLRWLSARQQSMALAVANSHLLSLFGSRPCDHYFRIVSVGLFVCLCRVFLSHL